MVKRQVRNPRFQMPSFSEEQVNDEELETIAQYITSLEAEGHAHTEPVDLTGAVEMHHWTALEALKAGDRAEAIHHVGHVIELLEKGEHQQRMEAILDSLGSGDTHGSEHEIEEMLAVRAAPDLTLAPSLAGGALFVLRGYLGFAIDGVTVFSRRATVHSARDLRLLILGRFKSVDLYLAG